MQYYCYPRDSCIHHLTPKAGSGHGGCVDGLAHLEKAAFYIAASLLTASRPISSDLNAGSTSLRRYEPPLTAILFTYLLRKVSFTRVILTLCPYL